MRISTAVDSASPSVNTHWGRNEMSYNAKGGSVMIDERGNVV
jgi:hypothetical protein